MVKIIFEVSEDLINEKADVKNITSKVNDDTKASSVMSMMVDLIGFSHLKERVDKGETEFTVSPDNLDDKMKMIYENSVGTLCVLAVFSEKDKGKEL